VCDVNGLVILDRDEHMRPDTDMEALAALKPSFKMMAEQAGFAAVAIQAHPEIEALDHVHHAGTSSGVVDGAAAVLIGSAQAGRALGRKPRARIRAFANVGSDPALMLTGPIEVTRKALRRAGMHVGNIDLFEVNEAFASVPLAWLKHTGADPEKLNIHGGAIALGHPLGASGTKLMATLVHALKRHGKKYGLQTMCEGGGVANVTIVEAL
jgi:acetyl-CoA C-acetyltransferase